MSSHVYVSGAGAMGRIGWVCALLAAVFALSPDGHAQQKKPAAEKPAAAAPAQVPPAAQVVPDAFKLNLLIRSTIIALNQANKTGNYTVLQDLSAPAFRAANDSTRLAQVFANLRARNLDLTPVLFFTPKLMQQPMVNANGILRLAGYFPTDPERVNFDLYFQQINGDWRIFGLGVSVTPNDQTAALPAQPDAPAPAGQGQNAGVAPAAASGGAQQAKPRAAARKEATAPAAAGKQKPAATAETAVENRTTSNAVRIDLGKQWQANSEEHDGQAAPSR